MIRSYKFRYHIRIGDRLETRYYTLEQLERGLAFLNAPNYQVVGRSLGTGLPDLKQREIYEGDICEIGIKTTAGWIKKRGVMELSPEGTFMVNSQMNDSWVVTGETETPEIVGNIFDSPKEVLV